MSDQRLTASIPIPLPLPSHYDPARVEQVWRVPYHERAGEALVWAEQNAIRTAAADQFKINLILVDVQNTFCLPEFELFVSGRSGMGAIEDNQRLCEFIYHNMGAITRITLTMDTHRAVQIFHPVYLVDEEGNHPIPHTLVTHQDVVEGRWRFNPDIAANLGINPEDGQRHLLHYTRELEKAQKYALTVWPYHAMLGGIGHALVSAVEEAIFFHTIARQSQPDIVIKGQITNSESYSAIGPEVLHDPAGRPLGSKDPRFLRSVKEYDMVVLAGQAKSHCVAWTVADLLDQIQAENPQLAKKIYLLEDCTSPVVVPGVIDYTEQANRAFDRFQQAGMHIVRSSEPIASWPGM